MNWRRSLIAFGLVLPVLALLAFGLTRDATLIPSPLPGTAAPAFALEVMEPPETAGPLAVLAHGGEALTEPPEQGDWLQPGDTVRLADHAGDVVVLNFWASWCLACRAEHAILSSVAARYAGAGVRFYGVLYNDTPENGRRWISQMGGQAYPTLLDPGSRTAIEYGLYGVPETFFIGPDGRVGHKQIGPVTERILVEQIEALLGGAPREDR